MKTFSSILISLLISITIYGQFPDSETDGKYYEVIGAKLWTVSFGEGDPLFFIAGGPGNNHYGLRRFDSLSTTNTLVYYDAFGRGKSDTLKLSRNILLKEILKTWKVCAKRWAFQKLIFSVIHTAEWLHRVTQLNILKMYLT